MRVRLCFLFNCAATIFLAVIAAVLYARWQAPVYRAGTTSNHYTVLGDNPHKGLPGHDYSTAGTIHTVSGTSHGVQPRPTAHPVTPQPAAPARGGGKNSKGSFTPQGATTPGLLPHKAGSSDGQRSAHDGAAEPATAASPLDTEVPDIVLEALGPHVEAMPPRTHVAIINCVNWHFEIVLGFAQVLEMMHMNTTVYTITTTIRATTAGQLLKRLDKNIKIRPCMDYKPKDVDRAHLAILVSAQEEIYIRTPGMFVFRAVQPKVALSIHHNTASYRRGLMAHIFSWHPRMYMMTLAPAPLDIMTKVISENYRKHAGYFNWILPIYRYIPKHACSVATLPCQHHFTVQGRLEQERRNYSRLFEELQTDDVDPRLHIKLVGNPVPESPMSIPKGLEIMVKIHPNLPFQEYYEVIHHSAGLLPLFSTDNYIAGSKISSTVVTSLICNVPLLASQALLDAYPFLTKESCYLVKAGQTELEAMNTVVQRTPREHAATRAALEEVRKAELLRSIRVLNDVMKMRTFSVPLK